jgi:hypothetical protein
MCEPDFLRACGVRFEGERMVLIPPPRLTGESEEHREITWERIAAE